MALTKERGELDMRRMQAENELRQCQHAKQTLEMEKDILQKDVVSLQKQLDDKSDALRQSWSDASAKVITSAQPFLLPAWLLNVCGSTPVLPG